MADQQTWKGILKPDVLHQRAAKSKPSLPIGPVVVVEETWFLARKEVCRLLRASLDEVEVLKVEP